MIGTSVLERYRIENRAITSQGERQKLCSGSSNSDPKRSWRPFTRRLTSEHLAQIEAFVPLSRNIGKDLTVERYAAGKQEEAAAHVLGIRAAEEPRILHVID